MSARIDTGIGAAGQERIQGLDELRGFAVLWVVLLHSWGALAGETPLEIVAEKFIRAGWLGVDLFFALSGFLITRILLANRGQAGALLTFYRRRCLRIFPLYFAVLGLAFACDPERRGWLPLFALYGQNFYPGEYPDLIGGFTLSHFWSLCVEEHFYLAWPVVVLWVPRSRLLSIALGVAVASLVLRLAAVEVFFWRPEFIARNSFCRFDSIALGAVVALVQFRRVSLWWAVAGSGVAVFALVAFLDPMRPFMLTVGKSIVGVWAASVVGLVSVSGGFGSRAAWLTEIGRVSYGLYVFHFLTIAPLGHSFGPFRAGFGFFLGGGIIFAVVCGAGLFLSRLSWVLLERPLLRCR